MKIECIREHLLETIALAEKISGKNLTLPVLNCLLLEAKGKSLIIRATNLEIGLEVTLPVKVIKEGVVAVPGGVLEHTVASIYESRSITLEAENENLNISTGGGKTTIKAQPHVDFPSIPTTKSVHTFPVKTEEFVRGIRSVWYSASLSTIKPELSSVYIYQDNKKVYFVATDSFRLAEKMVILGPSVPAFNSILVPIQNIPLILRTLENAPEQVELQLSSNQLSIVFGDTYLTSRLVDGSFPDYKQIIPRKSTTQAVVLKQDLVHLFKKINIFSDTFKQVHFNVNPKSKSMALSSKSSDVGETNDTVNAALAGEELEINFNHRYITDCFQSIPSDSVELAFGGLARPMTIKGVSDNSFLYLVMPMNK